ncbi:MAG: LysR family transcriptional regulator [Kordiimonas sp.]
MDKLRAMKLYTRLADLGSFTKVADELNASKSMISKEITRLEQEVGARLINRTTRRLQLTDIGEGYLARCRKLLLQMEDADNYVQDMQGAPRGKLKVNAPMALGITDLGEAFADFMAAYPDIEIDMHLGDAPLDLVEHGFDLGFRVASKQFDSQYIGKPIMKFSYKVCVGADYLRSHGPVENVRDLQNKNCFIYSYFMGQNVWPLEGGVEIGGTLKVNNTIFMLEVIKKGLGIGFVPDFIARAAVDAGEVVEILSDVQKPELTLYAMYPNRQFVPPKISRCIEFLQRWFRDNYKT